MIANSSLDLESVGLIRDYVNELLQHVFSCMRACFMLEF